MALTRGFTRLGPRSHVLTKAHRGPFLPHVCPTLPLMCPTKTYKTGTGWGIERFVLSPKRLPVGAGKGASVRSRDFLRHPCGSVVTFSNPTSAAYALGKRDA